MFESLHFNYMGQNTSLTGLLTVFFLLISLSIAGCSNATRYEPSPEEILTLLLTFPPVIVPPVTPINESTTELETVTSMGQWYVDLGTGGFRSYVSHIQNTEALPLETERGFKWVRDPASYATSMELRAWLERGVQFEMDYTLSGGFPAHFYPTRGWLTPSLSDGEMQHQTTKMIWSTDEEGLSLEIENSIGSFAAFDSTLGGGWIKFHSGPGIESGHSANWDAEGNITLHSWISGNL